MKVWKNKRGTKQRGQDSLMRVPCMARGLDSLVSFAASINWLNATAIANGRGRSHNSQNRLKLLFTLPPLRAIFFVAD